MDDCGSGDIKDIIKKANPTLKDIDKPLMQFFRRLIVSHDSHNTILTDSQLKEILYEEFDINPTGVHSLKLNVYTSVLKKYLKEWKMWSEFHDTIKTSPLNKALLEKIHDQYKNLKMFLQTKLEISCPIADEYIRKLDNDPEIVESDETNNDLQKVVLEIQASREQLNQLFFRHPSRLSSNTVFNIDQEPPSQIKMNTLPLEAILNWWSISIQIKLQWSQNMTYMFMKRDTIHQLKHLLVNKKLGKQTNNLVILNDSMQIRETRKGKRVPKDEILACLDLLCKKQKEHISGLKTIMKYLRKDFAKVPICIAPAQYRRCLNKHPYIRYLYTESPSSSKSQNKKYDLQLMETLTPMHQFAIGKVEGKLDPNLPPDWLQIDCVSCGRKFVGDNLVVDLQQHFDEYHGSEPDWQCMNCEKTFSMEFLARSWWHHECIITCIPK